MSAKDKLMALAGGNILESIDRDRGTAPVQPSPPPANRYRGVDRIKGALAIPLDRITPDPEQPRKEFDQEAIVDLAASLKERGQLQPARVRWDEGLGSWVIVSGERRYRAAQLAGLPSLQAVEAFGSLTPEEILEDQLVENCLREDLKPVEQARAFKTLMAARGWSHRQLGEHLHIAPSAVSQALALTRLPADVQERVDEGTLAASAAYELSKLGDATAQAELAARVVTEGLNRAETVEAVRRASGRSTKSKGRGAVKGCKMTSRVFRKLAGCTVSVENGRGLEPRVILEALELAAAAVRVEIGEGGQAAA